jgi:hypothetical protein
MSDLVAFCAKNPRTKETSCDAANTPRFDTPTRLRRAAWKSQGGNTTLTQLPVWDSPMMLAEREQVQLRKDTKP